VSTSLYDQLDESFFERLVDAFYLEVASNELLRAMYPEDLAESKRHLTLFLIQYWGGPPTYMEERGHPRLRRRHARFAITKEARDAWMTAMEAALASLRDELTDAQVEELHGYFDMAATQMRNV
jgi:hemoglobin